MDLEKLKAEKTKLLSDLKAAIVKLDEDSREWNAKQQSARDQLMTQAVEVQGQVKMLMAMSAPAAPPAE